MGDNSHWQLLDGEWSPAVGVITLFCQKLIAGCNEGAGDTGDCSPTAAIGELILSRTPSRPTENQPRSIVHRSIVHWLLP